MTVYREHSLWRALIFPFYSVKEVLVVGSVITCMVMIIWYLGPFRPLYQYAIVGYIGALVMNIRSSPAHSRLSSIQEQDVVEALKANGYSFNAKEHAWLPRMPKVLLRPHDRVRFQKDNGNLTVRGPYNVLVNLGKLL